MFHSRRSQKVQRRTALTERLVKIHWYWVSLAPVQLISLIQTRVHLPRDWRITINRKLDTPHPHQPQLLGDLLTREEVRAAQSPNQALAILPSPQ
jgi:hypothetical protein